MSNLQLQNNGSQDSLTASWELAQGSGRSYVLTLSSGGIRKLRRVIPFAHTVYLFTGLIPGKTYEVSVQTQGTRVLTSEVTASGQTGKSTLQVLFQNILNGPDDTTYMVEFDW